MHLTGHARARLIERVIPITNPDLVGKPISASLAEKIANDFLRNAPRRTQSGGASIFEDAQFGLYAVCNCRENKIITFGDQFSHE